MATPTLQEVGSYRLPADAPEGLSGLTWMGDNTFMVAEDTGGRLHTL